mmetsp:Transcript_2576/g.3829  ORF Transcript_2576/g.3829 Transcript_2576/m.3829 type:complete len:211 (-) Transcript_2576:448-1080(-)
MIEVALILLLGTGSIAVSVLITHVKDSNKRSAFAKQINQTMVFYKVPGEIQNVPENVPKKTKISPITFTKVKQEKIRIKNKNKSPKFVVHTAEILPEGHHKVNSRLSCTKPDMCAVCLEEINDPGSILVMLLCGHVFHAECVLEPWFGHGNNKCPFCQQDLRLLVLKQRLERRAEKKRLSSEKRNKRRMHIIKKMGMTSNNARQSSQTAQ